MNTPLTVTAKQAGAMLKAVRFATLMQPVLHDRSPETGLPELHELKGVETMLLAALERIRDKETMRR